MGIINYQIGNMAHVEVSALSKQQKDELVCTYAALMLHDGELEISEDKLKKVITASGNAVEGYWPGLFAKALRTRLPRSWFSSPAHRTTKSEMAPLVWLSWLVPFLRTPRSCLIEEYTRFVLQTGTRLHAISRLRILRKLLTLCPSARMTSSHL